MNSFICKGRVIKKNLYKRSLHYWEVVIIGGGEEFPMKTELWNDTF